MEAFLELLEQLGFKLNRREEVNKMFVRFELTKIKDCPNKCDPKETSSLLKACQYKKR